MLSSDMRLWRSFDANQKASSEDAEGYILLKRAVFCIYPNGNSLSSVADLHLGLVAAFFWSCICGANSAQRGSPNVHHF